MGAPLRAVGLALACGLLVATAGCTAYRVAALPGTIAEPGEAEQPPVVAPRADVRITLVTGEQVKGRVVRCSADEIVLGRSGNYGLEEDVYPASAIAAIEVPALTKGGEAGTALFIGALALVIYGLISLRNGWGAS